MEVAYECEYQFHLELPVFHMHQQSEFHQEHLNFFQPIKEKIEEKKR